MTSLKQQTEAKVAAGRQANPDFMKGIDEVIAEAKAFQQGGNALAVGQQVPAFVLNHMKVDRQLDLESINNGNGSVLPIPATFAIGTDGVISWRFVDVDYRTRSEPEDIIEALKKLSA